MNDLKQIWVKAKSILEESLPSSQSKTIKNIEFCGEDADTIILSARSAFHLSTIEKNCLDNIVNAVNEVSEKPLSVSFKVRDKNTETQEKKTTAQAKKGKESKAPLNPSLNKSYSFDSFVAGDNSILAYNAAKTIALNPGLSFNPFLIYGGVGLGKTHLLHAIGNLMEENNSKMSIIYVTAENFTNEFIDCLGKKGVVSFKNKYRSADCLLIDDIHFLQNKWQTQEELFHTFNELYDNQKQIVLTCDRPISELTDIKDRLTSRFRRGLNADLQPPDYETRVAIARKKCKENKYALSDEIINYVCEAVDSNVRDLEGALVTLASFSSLVGKPITLDIAKEQLKNFTPEPAIKNSNITMDMITNTVSKHFNIREYEIRSKNRNKNITLARHLSIYLMEKLTSYSMTEIGNTLGGMDHTSVIYAIKKIENLLETDESVREAVRSISEKLLAE